MRHPLGPALAAGAAGPARRRARLRAGPAPGAVAIALVLRRMRAPLIVLVVIFAVSVVGLSVIPGADADGRPYRMGFFEAFYVMSYTATTIGFGELPHPFTDAQRMWVVVAIYLTVVGWAYAVGTLLGLLQDRAFRQAVATRQFARTVAHLPEPFLLVAGAGRAGQLLGRSLDDLGRRFVVVDADPARVDALELEAYRQDVPGLVGDARDPEQLRQAGLDHPRCEGVAAITDDDETNLAVTMAAALLRPDLPVFARATSPAIEERMAAFGAPVVVDAFDRFGDDLRLALHAPSSYRLAGWLTGPPGAPVPARLDPPVRGRWVVCGYGRFGRHVAGDLRAEGLPVTVVDPAAEPGPGVVVGRGVEPEVLAATRLPDAVGFVAGTDNDTTNLSLMSAARSVNPRLFVVARQNQAANAPLFDAMGPDALLVAADVVAREVLARVASPLLARFLAALPAQDEQWSAGLLERLCARCGTSGLELWKVRLVPDEAPALLRGLPPGGVRLGDLLRDPEDRDRPLPAVALLLARGAAQELVPGDDERARAGDEVLLAGGRGARRGLDSTLAVDAAREYVLTGRVVAAGWVWRRLFPGRSPVHDTPPPRRRPR